MSVIASTVLDLMFWGIDDDFWGGKITGASLRQPVLAAIGNQQVQLEASDLVKVNGYNEDVPSKFSAAAAERARIAAEKKAEQDRQLALAHEASERQKAAMAEAAAPRPARHQSPKNVQKIGRLAVLELRNTARELTVDNVRYFTDVVRQATLRYAPQYDVMTRENLLILLQSTGRSLQDCEGECEVDTGRRIGADAIISGDIVRVGTRLKLSIRLHETHESKLLGSAIGSGRTVDELDDGAQNAARELLTPQ
jgi:hypothetical protein